MARSIGLGLYLFLAEHGRSLPPAITAERPDGPLVWLYAGPGSRVESLRQLSQYLSRERPGLTVLVTHDPATDVGGLEGIDGLVLAPAPSEQLPDVRAFLDHWRPDAALFVGAALPAALIAEAHARAVPLILADAYLGRDRTPFWRRGMTGSVLGRFSRILAPDAESVAALRRLGGRSLNVELAGRIEETPQPLSHNEAEREDIAERLRARPVWLAVDCPEAEEQAVIEAHVNALSYAHRLLLIVTPHDAARADALAARFAAEGLVAAVRARDEEADADVQVLIADGVTELGLWYRLAPVTFMGGSLSGQGPGRDPIEPAVLGSAVVHGPATDAYAGPYARLTEARAARRVGGPHDLAVAIADLIAPDKAALLAHNAWAATSGGAEVAERLVQIVLQTLDAADARRVVR